jgi:septation ring formation regulator EzrA
MEHNEAGNVFGATLTLRKEFADVLMKVVEHRNESYRLRQELETQSRPFQEKIEETEKQIQNVEALSSSCFQFLSLLSGISFSTSLSLLR